LVLNLRPRRVDLLAQGDDPVVAAARHQRRECHHRHRSPHRSSLPAPAGAAAAEAPATEPSEATTTAAEGAAKAAGIEPAATPVQRPWPTTVCKHEADEDQDDHQEDEGDGIDPWPASR